MIFLYFKETFININTILGGHFISFIISNKKNIRINIFNINFLYKKKKNKNIFIRFMIRIKIYSNTNIRKRFFFILVTLPNNINDKLVVKIYILCVF